MSIEEFKQYHSETIMYCQCIEHDLKWIYSYMHKGDQYDTFDKLEKKTLGTLIKMLKSLDNSSGKLFISNDDYNFLKQMSEKRNYWCHQCFIEFIYEEDYSCSDEYNAVCNKLKRDHDRLERVSNIVEKIRLEAVDTYKR